MQSPWQINSIQLVASFYSMMTASQRTSKPSHSSWPILREMVTYHPRDN